MRICLVTTFFPPYHFGGDAVFVANLANALASDSHEVEVVHCKNSFDLLKSAVQPSAFQLHERVRVWTLDSGWGALSPLFTFVTGYPGPKVKSLKEILSADFDVVHWHNLSLVAGPGGLQLGKGVRLCTLHDYWWICPTHILFKFNEEACTEPSCLKCELIHKRPPQPWRAGTALRSAASEIDRFIAPSEFVRTKYRESTLAIDAEVIPHFVPTPTTPDSSEIREDYYIFVGRLEKAKGLQTIIPTFRKSGRRLIVAGSGNYEPELRRLADGASNIEFRGKVPHTELRTLYSKARATIVPSICYETFGLTVLESLRARTPVIVSAFGALPELISSTQGGVVYRTIEELEALLNELDANPEKRLKLGDRGFQSLARYSTRAHLEQYYRVIETCRGQKSQLPVVTQIKNEGPL